MLLSVISFYHTFATRRKPLYYFVSVAHDMSASLAHDMSAFSGEGKVQLDWLNEDLPGNRDGESDEDTRGNTESNRQTDHVGTSSGDNQSKRATVETMASWVGESWI